MTIDPYELFEKVETDRKNGELSAKVTTAKLSYQASSRLGYIEQINHETGERRIGAFSNGTFTQLGESDKN